MRAVWWPTRRVWNPTSICSTTCSNAPVGAQPPGAAKPDAADTRPGRRAAGRPQGGGTGSPRAPGVAGPAAADDAAGVAEALVPTAPAAPRAQADPAETWELDQGTVSDPRWPSADDAGAPTGVGADGSDPSSELLAGEDGADAAIDADAQAGPDQPGWLNPATAILEQSDAPFSADDDEVAGLAPPALMALLDSPSPGRGRASGARQLPQPPAELGRGGPPAPSPSSLGRRRVPNGPPPNGDLWSETGTPGWLDEGERRRQRGRGEGDDNLIHLARPWSEPESPAASGDELAPDLCHGPSEDR